LVAGIFRIVLIPDVLQGDRRRQVATVANYSQPFIPTIDLGRKLARFEFSQGLQEFAFDLHSIGIELIRGRKYLELVCISLYTSRFLKVLL
jgi:hypothetical protein